MKTIKLLLITTMLMLASCNSKAAVAAVDDTRPDQITATDVDDDSSEPDTDTDATDEDDAVPVEPLIYTVGHLVYDFNLAGEEEDVYVEYDEENNYWIYTHIEPTVDDTKETLQQDVYHYLDFVPLYKVKENGYMFRYKEHYDVDTNTYTYVAVSSNWFAAITISSCIQSSELTTNVMIYDGRTGLHI